MSLLRRGAVSAATRSLGRNQRSAPTKDTASARSKPSVIAYLAFLGVLLATGVDIALPAFDAIEADLFEGQVGATNVSLMITIYFVGMALGQLVVGPFADRFGRRPVILVGLALYVAGAIASAVAPTFAVLLLARLLWGLGASAPAGLRSAIARDLYDGDEMARVTTIMMAVFLLGPVVMPLFGELLMSIAPWQIVFWFSASLAVLGAVWCALFGETLAPANQRSLSSKDLADGFMIVLRTVSTRRYTIANMFMSAAFFIFLASAQPVFDQVYDRSSQFAVLFGLTGLITIGPLLLNNKLIDRYGGRRMSMLACGASTVVSVFGLVPTLLADGRPTFWLWYIWLVLVTSLLTVATPPLVALALEPMDDLAGTASSVLFCSGFAGGAGLAAIFSAFVDTTVTPFVLGFAVYTVIGFFFLWRAGLGLNSAD